MLTQSPPLVDMVECLIEDSRWNAVDLEALAEAAAQNTLVELGYEPSHFSLDLLACDDARIAQLNTDFRGKPSPTNVLSWPSSERSAAVFGELPPRLNTPQDCELGDIAIAFETCKCEAQSAGISFSDHITHLLVHGVLHLLGFDHSDDEDADLMEALEVKILQQMGLKNPYLKM